MADVKAAVDTEDLLEDGRGENKAVGVDVDDEDDYFMFSQRTEQHPCISSRDLRPSNKR
jgi:hypothetical protein